MKINSVSSGVNFRAYFSPEVKNGFLHMLNNADETNVKGRKIIKSISILNEEYPHIFLSIKKYDLQGDIYYGYMKTDSRFGKTVGISHLEDNKGDLFTGKHLEDIVSDLQGENVRRTSPRKIHDILNELKEKLQEKRHIVSIWILPKNSNN